MKFQNKDTTLLRIRNLIDKIYSIDYLRIAKPFIIITFSLVVIIHLTITAFKTKSVDFYAFYTGAGLLITNKDELYNPYEQYKLQESYFQEGYTFDTGFMAFITLPLSALIYVPFLVIPPKIAAELVHVMSILGILYCLVRLYKFHHVKLISWTTLAVAYFFPLYGVVHLAQIGILIFIILTEMYLAYMKKQTLRLGLLSSLLVLKYQYLGLIPLVFAIYPEKKKYLFVVFPATIVLLLVNYLMMGPELVKQYIELIRMYQFSPLKFGMEYKYGMDIISFIFVLIHQLENFNIFLLMVGFLFFSYLITTIFLLKNKRYKKGSDIFYVCLIFALIMSPHTMPSDFLFLLIPIIGLLPRIRTVWFCVVTVFILDLFFYFSVYGRQWTHTILLLIYLFLLLAFTFKAPGKLGKIMQNAMVGDPGVEPGTARV